MRWSSMCSSYLFADRVVGDVVGGFVGGIVEMAEECGFGWEGEIVNQR